MDADAPERVPDDLDYDARRRLLENYADEDSHLPAVRAVVSLLSPDPRVAARQALAIVQALPQVDDPREPDGSPGEWFARASWTLRYGGDCDDKIETYAALMRAWALRYGRGRVAVRIERLPVDGAAQDHWTGRTSIAGGPWEWSDATVADAQLGEDPRAAVRRSGHALTHGVIR